MLSAALALAPLSHVLAALPPPAGADAVEGVLSPGDRPQPQGRALRTDKSGGIAGGVNCDDPFAEHGAGATKACNARCLGETMSCTATFFNLDGFEDSLQLLEAFDTVDGSIRVPAAGNLPIIAVLGNASCTGATCNPATGAACSFPCIVCTAGASDSHGGLACPGLPQAGAVRVRQNSHVITHTSVTPDTISFIYEDNCDSACDNCPTTQLTTPAASGTLASDCDDGDPCTIDCCELGVCSHPSDCVGATCRDVNGDVVTIPPETCDDDDVCTSDVCLNDTDLQTPCCENPPIPCPEQACFDLNGCDPILGCQYSSECLDPNRCDDNDVCTSDICDENLDDCCDNPPIPCAPRVCFNNTGCDPIDGCQYESVCTDPNFCDDGDPCTEDICDTGAAGCCVHNFICGCSLTIAKTVARDDDCDGTADGAFTDSVTQDAGECVVYRICVTNNGQQDVSTVIVNDTGLGGTGGTLSFGTVIVGDTECQLIPTDAPVGDCAGGSCVCEDVEGVNTVEITSAVCVETGDDACVQPNSDCDDSASVECVGRGVICRTPGFWGTHACGADGINCEESEARNLTQIVVDSCGGCVEICGDVIDNTLLGDADSALEAICVEPDGRQILQLARQLTAAALNCCASFGDATCGGTGIGSIFGLCNHACVKEQRAVQVGLDRVDCIKALDCFNNGHGFDPRSGSCVDEVDSCRDRLLGLCADGSLCDDTNTTGPAGSPVCDSDGSPCRPGPAGSDGVCNGAAKQNACTVIPVQGTSCATGTNGPESCP